MSSQVITESGLKADTGFAVREPLWGGVGVTLPEDQRPDNWADARRLAGLQWDPIEETCYRQHITMEDGSPRTVYSEVPEFKYVVRSDNGRILSQANATYEIVSNGDMGLIMDALLGRGSADGPKLNFETAGSLHGGRKVWALLEMGDEMEINGDPSPYKRYLAILNTHDGSGAVKAISTTVRVECWNSWKMADLDAKANGTAYSFHHSVGWKTRIEKIAEEARLAISGVMKQHDDYFHLANELMSLDVTPSQEQRFCEEFIRPTSMDWRLKPKALENVNERRDELLALIRQSPTCEPIRPSAYRLVQGAGELCDHVRGTKHGGLRGQEARLDRSVFRTYDLKRRARTLALLAADGEL